MATIITDLKETFRRGNIYIQLIYINVAVFILTTLTEVMFQLFNRSIAGVYSNGWNCRHQSSLHPATMVTTDIYVHACRIHAHSFQYAVAVLVRYIVPVVSSLQSISGVYTFWEVSAAVYCIWPPITYFPYFSSQVTDYSSW